MALALSLGGIVVRLRREGLDLGTIARKAVQQPAWWRSWYPRRLRRRGDVWDRLPRSMRQVRVFKGGLLAFVWAGLLPLWLLSRLDRRLSLAPGMLLIAGIGGIAIMFALRRRAARDIRARCGATAAEISALLNTPTWRIGAWRRQPAAALLHAQGSAARTTAASDPDATRGAVTLEGDEPTGRLH